MLIEVIVAGPLETNSYFVADQAGSPALVIDAPPSSTASLVARGRIWHSPITHLVNTHAHFDHYLDNAAVVRETGARFGLHRDGVPLLSLPQAQMFGYDLANEPCQPSFFLEEGRTLCVGDLHFEVFHCPGHCPGSVALFERSERVVFVGDVLFSGSIGRADLPGGNQQMLLNSIHEKLLPLGDDVRVFSGHGPATTIGQERRQNPFLNR
jgi:hydroxyacylglutathione hydrolase